MWLALFKFEFQYRLKRPETYLFFGFLFLFSIVGVDFIFQGVEIGLMKKNAPIVIAKTMGAITGLFMIMVSMIMGVPVLRDYQYDIQALLFVNPITKRDYLLGKFLGSFTMLLFIFSGLLLGLMVGSLMPWHQPEQMLPFNAFSYIQSFVVVVLPILFFGASVFFVTGMLSKKLLVVYTQGIVVFVIFLLTKAITNEYVQGLLDPFSLTTLTQVAKDWSVHQSNTQGIGLQGILLHNKLFWVALGSIVLLAGYRRFSFSLRSKKNRGKTVHGAAVQDSFKSTGPIPKVGQHHSFWAQCTQWYELAKFYTISLLKETSFWAIVICGMVIIVINSVNLGTVYGVDSYPATHFIIAELQEMSLYFFMVILLFYSGELIWKERTIIQYHLNDTTPIPNLVVLTSKFMALNGIYVVLMLALIGAGVLFQVASGFYEFELGVYCSGFFLEILPFLTLYTCIAFFLQVVSKNKFIGIFLTLIFFIVNVGTEALGFNHSLYKFGGQPLGTYSEMNGYGHFLEPYLWVKAYWLAFGSIVMVLSALFMNRGMEMRLWQRIRSVHHKMNPPIKWVVSSSIAVWLLIGGYIFYNTNMVNSYWTSEQEEAFRADYERTLKPLEYFPQPKITAAQLDIELYPETRSYAIEGSYELTNTTKAPIQEIHIQKRLATHVDLGKIVFEGGAKADSTYAEFDYIIYHLSTPLPPKGTVRMDFKQTFVPKGFEHDPTNTPLVYNGTFFHNTLFPSLGYNRKYELHDPDQRSAMDLSPRPDKAAIDDENELVNARSGSDSDGIILEITLGTSNGQTAVAPGKLQKQWTENDRNYFQYKTDQPIINFYSIVSADYEVQRAIWTPSDSISQPVALEIYHHAAHDYNLDRMMASMKASLSYYSENFSPYQYEQLRIMEVPRYADFAQSLPNTIPFSEALGFVLDIDDEEDVDMAFYITAHEVAHQWFGMQVEAANVQGKNFVLETLAQYGALMVLKAHYPEEKVQQFLALQKEIYDTKRKKATHEPSLALVENQDFIYYHKGAIAMCQLQELIGEEQVNRALRQFINDWRSYTGALKVKTNRYATAKELLAYFKAVTPIAKQQQLTVLFESNTEIAWPSPQE